MGVWSLESGMEEGDLLWRWGRMRAWEGERKRWLKVFVSSFLFGDGGGDWHVGRVYY